MNENLKNQMIDELKSQIESTFENEVKHAFNNNPMKDTPLEGMIIHNKIAETSGVLKSTLNGLKDKFNLTEVEVNNLVDDVCSKILNKYLKF
jgi:hypothetical protein